MQDEENGLDPRLICRYGGDNIANVEENEITPFAGTAS
jgi:hypothetical protein